MDFVGRGRGLMLGCLWRRLWLALELPGAPYSRGYIQAYWGAGNPIPERSAQRILKAADQILKAGTAVQS